jgi:hypothetical protein
MVVLSAFVSLAVDLGRVQVAKTELRSVADAAARHATRGLSDSTYLAKAQDVATANTCDGVAVSLQSADVEAGTWSNGTFTPGGSSPNSVRVTARRSAARGNPISLAFGKVIGRSTCDVTAVSIAMSSGGGTRGFIGLDGIEFKNNAFIGSYQSSVTTNPTSGSSTGNGMLQSNALIDFKNNATVSGNITLGPSGSIVNGNNLAITGTTTNQATAITAPAPPAWTPGANPNGVPQNYTVSSNTTLPGGTYWFTSLTVDKQLTFSGPATVYVNGNIWTDDSIVTYQSKPSNLKIYQLGANRTFDVEKDLTLVAEVYAPASVLNGKNKLNLHGNGLYKSITVKNNAELFYDEQSGGGASGGAVTLVK